MGHVLMENRNGLVVDATTTTATGTAEREAAIAMVGIVPTAGASRAEVWIGPHGHCCKKCNCVDEREIEFAVDGIDADLSAVRRGQAPWPPSGAPKAQGLTMTQSPGTQSTKPSIAISSDTV
jgi:hypothetical protein